MNDILIVAEHLRGRLATITGEMIGVGAALKADSGGGQLRVLVISDEIDQFIGDLTLTGVDEIIQARVGDGHFDSQSYAQIVTEVAARIRPAVILAGHTADGMAFAPAVAVHLGAGFASNVTAFEWRAGSLQITRSVYESKVTARLSFPGQCVVVLTLGGGMFPPPEPGGRPAISVFEPNEPVTTAQRHVAFIEPETKGVSIGDAVVILSIGRGVQEAENVGRFAAAADRLGLTLGCSRPIIDAGWLNRGHQVGLTGAVAVNCKLYIALGISGAVQHLYGMKHVDTIVAVNKDPNAPIFNVATHGVCMDLFEFMDALERQFN